MSRNPFATEQYHTHETVLLVVEQKNKFVETLRSHFIRHDVRVHFSLKINNAKQYQFIFIIGSPRFIQTYKTNKTSENQIHVYFIESRSALNKITRTDDGHDIIVIGDAAFAAKKIENIMWHILEHKSHGTSLILESLYPTEPQQHLGTSRQLKNYFKISRFVNSLKKWKPLFICGIIFGVLFGFTIPLIMSTLFAYKSLQATQQYDFENVRSLNIQSKRYLIIAEKLYTPVRPLYLLLSLAQLPEDLFFINNTASKLTHSTELIIAESKHFSSLLFQKNRNEELANETRVSYDKINILLSELEQSSVALYRKVPEFALNSTQRKEIEDSINQLKKARRLFTYLPLLLGEQQSQKILLLFANNMELRPGGGFIGSFGILELAHFGVQDLHVYDVYDADGQLTAHIEPPHPIRTYLGQPHWFLRDSAFFPDFLQTYKQAKVFLDKEIGPTDWDGGILITTSAVKDIIGAFGSIYLPDYKETITRDNFYIKTQYQAENDFFPGSTQKKSFLSDLVKQLFIEMEQVNSIELAVAVVRSLDQKFITVQSEHPEIQKTLNNLYWTGRTATPFCPPSVSENCFSDYQMVLDANLGVNKVNTFIDRTYQTATVIDDTGLAVTTLTLTYTNKALINVYPGGSYVNYLQLHLPEDARVIYVSRDRQRLESYDTQTEKQKVVGFLVTLPPQESTTIEVQYSASLRFKSGTAVYQLVVQKQIGAFSNDLSFSLTLPPNMHLRNTNFSPLVKDGQIIYNTDLSTDRVFFIELSKE